MFSRKKERREISSQISLEFSFTHRKANAFKKIFMLHGLAAQKYYYITDSLSN